MAVVGLVLLIGLVAVASVGILLVATDANEQGKQEATDERVEGSFVELARDTDSVGRTGDESRRVDLDLPDGPDNVVRRERTGKIVVNRTNLTTTETVVVKEIGAVVYESEDTHYAYQAGAVWSGTGNRTRMVSAPPIEYETNRRGSSPTLNLRIVDLQGRETLQSGDFRVVANGTVAPLNDVSRIDNQVVTVKITSDYYVGWADYFSNRYENAVVSLDHPNRTAIVELGKRDIDGDFSNAVHTVDDTTIQPGGGGISGPVTAGGTVDDNSGGPPGSGLDCSDANVDCGSPMPYAPLDGVIAAKLDDAESNAPDVTTPLRTGDHTLTAGAYYTEGFELDGTTLTLDLQNGNVSLMVDGPVGITGGGSIEVINADQNATCCYARLYVGGGPTDAEGDIAINQGHSETVIYADNGVTKTNNATRLQIYGTSEMQFYTGQMPAGEGFNGVVYAPRSSPASGDNAAASASPYPAVDTGASAIGSCSATTDACVGTGAGTVNGGLIGFYDFENTAAASVTWDADLDTVEPELGYAGVVPPPITYVHVSVNRVCLGEEDCSDP